MRFDAAIPCGLWHIIIAVRKDGSAVLFGSVDGCWSGQAKLGAGVHGEIYGQEANVPELHS